MTKTSEIAANQNANSTNKLNTIDYSTLMGQEFTPLKFSVSEILPQGLFILAGAPKIGKSWLTLDICHSIAVGNELWGYSTTKSDVLYTGMKTRDIVIIPVIINSKQNNTVMTYRYKFCFQQVAII